MAVRYCEGTDSTRVETTKGKTFTKVQVKRILDRERITSP